MFEAYFLAFLSITTIPIIKTTIIIITTINSFFLFDAVRMAQELRKTILRPRKVEF